MNHSWHILSLWVIAAGLDVAEVLLWLAGVPNRYGRLPPRSNLRGTDEG
jgi:hypothetical protein